MQISRDWPVASMENMHNFGAHRQGALREKRAGVWPQAA
jgi:hypothetical protein